MHLSLKWPQVAITRLLYSVVFLVFRLLFMFKTSCSQQILMADVQDVFKVCSLK